MSNENRDHDRLASRLTQILIKLNQGEQLDPELLAIEFAVHRRTILRDLNERFAFLPLEREEGRYFLDPAYLGQLTFLDVERFASLAGLNGLFPALNGEFLRELFDSRFQNAMLVHGTSYEEIRGRLSEFRRLQHAVIESREISFDYHKDEESKAVTVQPYKLINHSGVWYLAATDSGMPKAYAFGKIKGLVVSDRCFTPNQATKAMLDEEDSIWLNDNKTEVVLKVAKPAAHYFRRRKLISRQVIEKELSDGSILVSGLFAHPDQILPIIRYWIPNVRIVSPESWQGNMELGLQDYLSKSGRQEHLQRGNQSWQ